MNASSENKIVAAWLRLEESLMQRVQELGNMCLECRQFDSLLSELDRWIFTVSIVISFNSKLIPWYVNMYLLYLLNN